MKKNHLFEVKNFFNNSSYLNNSSYRIFVRKIIVNDLIKYNNISPSSILDLGCGNGELSINVASNFQSSLSLVDLSPYMIKESKKNVSLFKLNNVRYILGSFEKAPKQKFDLIFSVGLVAHVPNVNTLLRQISLRLKKNSYLILETTPNPFPLKKIFFPYYFLKKLFGFDEKTLYKKNRTSVNDIVNILSIYDLKLCKHVKYNIPLPGMRLWPVWTKNLYTYYTYKLKLLAYFGSESILLFKKIK